MNGLNLTDYTADELKTIYTALGLYLVISNMVTPTEREAIDQFRTKLVEDGAIVRAAERVVNN